MRKWIVVLEVDGPEHCTNAWEALGWEDPEDWNLVSSTLFPKDTIVDVITQAEVACQIFS